MASSRGRTVEAMLNPAFPRIDVHIDSGIEFRKGRVVHLTRREFERVSQTKFRGLPLVIDLNELPHV